MWFGNKRQSHVSERTVHAQSAHGESSDKFGYSLGVIDLNKVTIPRPHTWSASSSFVFNSNSNTNPRSTVSH